MSTNISKNKQVKEVKFHETLLFEKNVHYSTEMTYKEFLERYMKENPDWDLEFVKQVWMELCAEANKRGEVEYKDAEGEEWDRDDFEEIFAECYLDEAVDKASEKLKKD